METLLPATTSAVESDEVAVRGAKSPYTFQCAPPLAGTEVGQVQFKGGNGTWYDLQLDGSDVKMTASHRMVTLFGPGVFRIDKDATAGATGVFGQYENDM